MRLGSYHFDIREVKERLTVIIVIIVGLLSILTVRLFYLQVYKGDIYRRFSEKNRITKLWIPARRGIIYDRNLNRIAGNRPSFNLTMTRAYVPNLHDTLFYLDELIKLEEDNLSERLKSIKRFHKYRPKTILIDMSRDHLALVETHKTNDLMKGINIDDTNIRHYFYNEIGAHLIGYIGEINERGLRELNRKEGVPKYKLGDFTGKFGIEKKYEEYLRGIDGIKAVEVDARGRIREEELIGEIYKKDLERKPKPGLGIVLNVDAELQKVSYESFKEGESGAIVAINPANGEILVLVSYPSFNPEIFAKRISKEKWAELNDNPFLPLIDKTVMGQYPPGSTYKMILLIAALEEGLIDKKFHVTCYGKFRFGNRTYRCHKEKGHGKVGLRDSIIKSCDVFYYKLGLKLGVDKIAEWAKKFGFGTNVGLGMNNEKEGLVPTSEWKYKAKKEKWQPGETISIAIGQGFNLATPIQLANYMATIANGGRLYKPYLLKTIITEKSDYDLENAVKPTLIKDLNLKEDTLKIVHEALHGVVNNPAGTAYWFARTKKVPISGKTGTAQVVALEKSEELDERRFKDHALFVAYAPSEDPKIALAVVVEHGGHGSSGASPKAKMIIEKYMEILEERRSADEVVEYSDEKKIEASNKEE